MKRLAALTAVLLLAATPALAAWSVTHKSNNHSSSAHTVVVSGLTIAAGHIAWVAVAARPAAAGDAIGVTDSAGNTYTVKQCPVAGSTNNTAAVAVAYMTTGLSAGSITVADGAAATATDLYADVSDITGGKTSSIDDSAVAACSVVTNNTTPTITSGSPSQTGDLVLGMTQYLTGTVLTDDATWTVVANTADTNQQFSAAYIVAGAGAVTRTGSLTVSKAWVNAVLALAPPAAASGALCTIAATGGGTC